MPHPPSPSCDFFRQLYLQHAAGVRRFLRRLGIPLRAVEDVAHDVFVTALRAVDTYDPARPARPWLYGIAWRVASDWRARAPHRRELMVSAEAPHPAPLADERLEDLQTQALVRLILDALDADKRAVFVLHEFEERPVPEIARSLGIPLNTAYSRLRLARARFAETLHAARPAVTDHRPLTQ